MKKHKESLSERRKFLGSLKVNVQNPNKVENETPVPVFKTFDDPNLFERGPDSRQCSSCNENKNELGGYDEKFLYCNETLEDETFPHLEDDPFHNSDNSKDSDYIPENNTDIDDSDIIVESPVKKIINIDQKFIITKKEKQEAQLIHVEHTMQRDQVLQCCEYRDCAEEIFSTCGKCHSLLCWPHFAEETPYNDCKNHEKSSEFSIGSKNCTDLQNFIQCCDYADCYKSVQSSCEKCLCFLCLDHFNTQDSENCKNHIKKENATKEKKKKKLRNEKENTKKPIFHEENEQHCEYVNCTQNVSGTCDKCFSLLCLDHYIIQANNISCDNHKPHSTGSTLEKPIFTKKGDIRKRKLYEENVESRKTKKKEMVMAKRALKMPCDSTNCKKRCTTKFNEDQRTQIHQRYIKLNYEAQGLFIKGMIGVNSVKTRKQSAIKVQRDAIYVYHLQSPENEKIEVCKTFFLTTLGFDPKNDRRVMTAIKKPIDEQKDLRGTFVRKDKIDRDLIKEHVMKYEPCIAHYRREHAPKRLYLPSDININIMYQNFRSQYPHLKISSETYRKVVRNDLNISFSHLGHEECEKCAMYQQHDKNHAQNENCEVCSEYEMHKLKYTSARQEYKNDVEKAKNTSTKDIIFDSVDLQKVIMLPRIDQYKAAIFCPRIVAFNESFVPLGPSSDDKKPFAVLWNETISGRNAEDIVSAFRAFLIHYRDTKHVVLWLDNCSGQNKNWTLLSFLIDIINSNLISTETITFKYFEPGHSFMSADSFHHQVELSLRRTNKVFDFEDFVSAVKMANSKKNTVKVMEISDSYTYKDFSSQSRLKKITPRVYLRNIVYFKAERGKFSLQYKLHHEDQNDQTLDFLMLKYIKKHEIPETEPKLTPRGISKTRKAAIIDKLVPLMPENRRRFWFNLPVSENNNDSEMFNNDF